jgi:RNA polymerase sigma factor (sigma-70 family)
LALAQNARQLSSRSVLLGWLHCTTRNLATKAVRSDVRRHVHELKAALMNELLSVDPENIWEQVAPHLDAGLAELTPDYRDAILLRYFDRKSAEEMARMLGISNDAAQKRVSRAVEHLKHLLAKRGITVGATGVLGAITANAVQAAPCTLAVAISHSLTIAGESIATTSIPTKALAMTTLQKAVITATIVASVLTSLVMRHRIRARQNAQDEFLRRGANELAQLSGDNERLSNLVGQAHGSAGRSQLKELEKLRAQAALLRDQTKNLAAVREASQHPRLPEPQTPLQVEEKSAARQYCMEAWTCAFIAYARANQGQLPNGFEQAVPFLTNGVKMEIDMSPDQLEILFHGSLDAAANRDIIVLREKALWPLATGKWGRLYGMADGRDGEATARSQYCSSSDKTANGTFDSFEQAHMATQTNQ